MICNLPRYKPLKENILKFVQLYVSATASKKWNISPCSNWPVATFPTINSNKYFKKLKIYLVLVVWKQKQLLILLSVASTKKKNLTFFKAIMISKFVLLIKINVTLENFFMKLIILVSHKKMLTNSYTNAANKYLLRPMRFEENNW